MGVLNPVVGRLGTRRVARQPISLPQGAELVSAPGEQLVHVALVPGVENDRIGGRLEHPVQGDRQFDNTQIGAQVTTGAATETEAAELATALGALAPGRPIPDVRHIDAASLARIVTLIEET